MGEIPEEKEEEEGHEDIKDKMEDRTSNGGDNFDEKEGLIPHERKLIPN